MKKPIEKVSKPYMTGAPVDRTTLSGAVKFFFGTLGMVLVYLLIGVMMNWESRFLNITINSVIIFAAMLLFYQTGMTSGADAVNQGEIMLAREEKGRPVEPWERQMCYHPMKGLVKALLGSIPLVLCSLFLALTAERQVANLGTLPQWISGLENRAEIGDPLMYYHYTSSLNLEAVIRFIVRMATMPYVNIVGATNRGAMLILERISPLLNLLPAVAYGVGYRNGTLVRTAVHTSIAQSRKKRARKQRKEQRARQNTSRNQLN